MKKLLLFGAGKIGRSFIGQLFSRGGYEVVFIDIDQKIITLFNERRSYPVIIKSDEKETRLEIKNVRAIHTSNQDKINEEILSADIIATAVGPDNLPSVIEILGEGLKNRFSSSQLNPVDIIIAENLRNASEYFLHELKNYLTEEILFDAVGLVETSIGKMVPIMSEKEMLKDPLMVYAEPYNTLILDAKGFRNSLPAIEGLAPKKDIKAWVDRKSFIHNLGHAAAAYFGYLKFPEKTLLYQVLADRKVFDFTETTMKESAESLILQYPGSFTRQGLYEHINDLIRRFQNKALGDTVYRVGRDLPRKLGPDDRLCGAIRMALKNRSPYDHMLYALIMGFYFRATNEKGKLFPNDRIFSDHLAKHGFDKTFQEFCKFEEREWNETKEMTTFIRKDIITKFSIENN